MTGEAAEQTRVGSCALSRTGRAVLRAAGFMSQRAALLLLALCANAADPIPVTITERELHRLSPLLFGQFMERASFGEPGPEAFLPGDGPAELPAPIVAALADQRAPVIRFPWGTDNDWCDWTDLIDHVPGRGARPATMTGHTGKTIGTRFGYAEYFRLRAQLGNETILVVNLLDGLARRKPLQDAARHAAGLVAWANAPVGAALPDGMPDWPAARAAAGLPEPQRVGWVQIGNEAFLGIFRDVVAAANPGLDRAALAAWYREVYAAYIAAIRAVDPGIRIIIDGDLGGRLEHEVLIDARLRREAPWAAIHAYAPGPMRAEGVKDRSGTPVDPATLEAERWWWLWSAMPGHYGSDGRARGVRSADAQHHTAQRLDFLATQGYRVVVTEWNWNGWNAGLKPPQPPDWARGVGAASFLHGLMRDPQVELATQSLLLGSRWDIATIFSPGPSGRLDRAPTGAPVRLYAHHHGDRVVAIDHPLLPAHDVGLRLGWQDSVPPAVAALDLVATADDRAWYLHALHRDPAAPVTLALRTASTAATAQLHVLTGRYARPRAPGEGHAIAAQRSTDTAIVAGALMVELPPASVAVVVIPRADAPRR